MSKELDSIMLEKSAAMFCSLSNQLVKELKRISIIMLAKIENEQYMLTDTEMKTLYFLIKTHYLYKHVYKAQNNNKNDILIKIVSIQTQNNIEPITIYYEVRKIMQNPKDAAQILKEIIEDHILLKSAIRVLKTFNLLSKLAEEPQNKTLKNALEEYQKNVKLFHSRN